MTTTPTWRCALCAVLMAAGACFAASPAPSPPPAPAVDAAPPAPTNSQLDAPLLYQLLIGEIELRSGEPGAAFEVILDAARRTRDEALFRRAVDIALQGRAGEQALAATRAWRTALPQSIDALRLQLQILAAMNRLPDIAEPLQALLALTPEAERPGVIAAIPRFLQRASDQNQGAALLEQVLAPYAASGPTRGPALVAVGRGWLGAGDSGKALAIARQTAIEEPTAPGPVLLALDTMAQQPEAEAVVSAYLQRTDVEPALRLAYVRALTSSQRYTDAVRQLEIAIKAQPGLAQPYLSLGALYLELHRPKDGEAALLRYVQLAQSAPKEAPPPKPDAQPGAGDDDDDDDAATPEHAEQGLVQAWLLLAQAAEQRNDYKAAESWLAKIDDPQRALDVQARRASMLVRQNRIAEARELLRRLPERGTDDTRAKFVAEAGVWRDAKRWKDAEAALAAANQRFPDDADLLYEQAMMAEKLDKMPEMEALLRRVIALKPDNAQAHNALGYSLADRRVRLPEARQLIQRALELSPNDPFITDSLGWVEFRLGNRDEALKHLRAAYRARPDPEIAAHLGEVLWAFGQQDEARKVWTEAKSKDAANDVLKETLGRLKVGL